MTLGSQQRSTVLRSNSQGDSQCLLPRSASSSSRGDNLLFVDNTMIEQECVLLHSTQGPPHDSLILERSLNIGSKLGSSNGNLCNFENPNNKPGVRAIQFIQKKFSAFRRRNTDHDLSGYTFTDPEVTITRDDSDTESPETPVENTADDQKMSLLRRCPCDCVFEPTSRASYWWSCIVSLAVLYNYCIIVYRFAFNEITSQTLMRWFLLDYSMDFIYILDIIKGLRTGYLEEGVLQIDTIKMRVHFMNSMTFYIDCLCLLPLDFLYLSIDFNSLLRCFRLIKIYKLLRFVDITERHTNFPNLIRTATMLLYLIMIFHWNACFFVKVMRNSPAFEKFNTDNSTVEMLYVHSLYWSVLSLTTISNLPSPRYMNEYAYCIVTMVGALLLFATVMGLVAHIVSSMHYARKEFQAKLDDVKTYMAQTNVPDSLQARVIQWFDYLWQVKKNISEQDSFGLLPDRLKAEIAIHIHLDTLKKVEIFQNTEAGFLKELVLRLEPVLFSPGDLVCRKGEVGKEMYIVKKGRLHVVDSTDKVLAVLQPGSYFGEISILNMGDVGNRRTASVKSVGYSDLFCLKKDALWDVLKDYPTARVRLESIAVRRLQREEDCKTKQQQTVRPFYQAQSDSVKAHQTLTAKSSAGSSRTIENSTHQEGSDGCRTSSRSQMYSPENSKHKFCRSPFRSNHSDVTLSCQSSLTSLTEQQRVRSTAQENNRSQLSYSAEITKANKELEEETQA